MRVNRNIGIGLGFIAVALILLVVLFNRNRRVERPIAGNDAQVDLVATGEEPVNRVGGVAYAIDDIPERTILTPDMFEIRPLDPGAPATGLVTDPQTQANGYITRGRILSGLPLRTADLIGPLGKVGLAAVIRPGLRGMTVPVTTDPTLHDLVRIGDSVDIVAAFDGQESRTIVQNVRVLAVDVFAKDYPIRVNAAQRGAYKADLPAGGVSPAPAVARTPGAAPQAGATATPGPPPAPTPTPPPSAAPAPALTLEVSPAQAAAISLAEAAGAPLDFLLRPRENITVPDVRVASANRRQLAPYAEFVKRQGGGAGTGRTTPVRQVSTPPRPPRGNNGGGGGGGGGGGRDNDGPLIFPTPIPIPTLEPMPPPQPKTYDIPIYADGKLVRTDTVRKPESD